jgi:hypothetical protein
MKIKTSEATPIQLNWLAAKAEGILDRIELEQVNGVWSVAIPDLGCSFEPSTCWTQGGPIIEREMIELVPQSPALWEAMYRNQHIPHDGPTPLIAAMRCYVASELGDEVDVPDELTMLEGVSK